MSITTNNHVRDLVSWNDLPSDDVRGEFAYVMAGLDPDDGLTEDGEGPEDLCYTPRFFDYRGDWYDTNEFVVIESEINPPGMRRPFAHTVPQGHELGRWAGIATDSHSTAVVIRWGADWSGMVDYKTVVVGYYVAD